MRKERFLTPLKNTEIPREFVFFDTETHIVPNKDGTTDLPFRLGVAIKITLDNSLRPMKRHVEVFYSPQEFMDLIIKYTRKKTRLWVIAHNIKFDIIVLNLVDLAHDCGFQFEPPIINNMMFIWKWKKDGNTVVLCDTANYGVHSVSDLGEKTALSKGKVDFSSVSDLHLIEYCRRDVEILETFMIEFITFLVTYNLGSLKYTIASQAMCAFRTSLMDEPPFIHTFNRALQLERKAYHGGRTEAFFIGTLPKENHYYMDVNSMYPHSMVVSDLPVEFKAWDTNVNIAYMPHRMKRWYCIAEVELETDQPIYPEVINNKLVFRTGKLRLQLCHSELEYAFDHCRVKKIYKLAMYRKGSMFERYVEFFYSLKQKYTLENNKLWRFITKLFLNSLYGKFGQKQPHRTEGKPVDYEGVIRNTHINMRTGRTSQEFFWYGTYYEEYKEGETSFSCPSIAAAITAQSRMTLWEYITKSSRQNTFYTDTDSLIVNKKGYENLKPYIHDDRLGMLNLEHIADDVSIFGAKDYRFGDINRKKGVPGTAKEIREGEWEYTQFLGFITWLNGGMSVPMHTEQRTKRRVSTYNKGHVMESGYVTPFHSPY